MDVEDDKRPRRRHTTTVSVIVNLIDSNNHAPELEKSQYHVRLPESAALDTHVLTFNSTDKDYGK